MICFAGNCRLSRYVAWCGTYHLSHCVDIVILHLRWEGIGVLQEMGIAELSVTG